jgi:CheY-like chemotaxis protein
MPGPDGIATTRGLKALDPEIDVVIATAYASKETRSDCLRNGASDFITKPFTFEALEGVLERVMARRRADD